MSNFITSGFAGPRAKIALLLLGSLAGVGAANATSPDSDVPSVVVRYSPQSLATDSGAADLYRRIKNAARRVCPDASNRDLRVMQLVEECRSQAIARAVQHIDNSRLAALHAAHSKNSG
jgi:UrcA family protein